MDLALRRDRAAHRRAGHHRHRGLVRGQVEAFKRRLRQRGCLLSQIQGIPYFYRQFGYTYALPLEGGLRLELRHVPSSPEPDCAFRRTTPDDVPVLQRLYDEAVQDLDIHAVRGEETWQYLETRAQGAASQRERWLVETHEGQAAGYFGIARYPFGEELCVDEVSHFSFKAALAGLQQLKALAVEREKPGIRLIHGGETITQHLIELGHRRIGCITGPSDVTPSADRVTGYQQALQKASIPIDEQLIVKGDFQYEGGYRAAQQLLALDDRPSAIFACNDLMAVGVIRAAQELGHRIPADLSVAGFDDVHLASFITPPLTTIAQPKYEIGVMATKMLLEQMQNHNQPPRQRLLDTQLVVRRSTGPVASEQPTGQPPKDHQDREDGGL